MHRVVARIDSHLAKSVKGNRTHVTFSEPIGLYYLPCGGAELIEGIGYIHLVYLGAAEEPPHVVSWPEKRRPFGGFITPHTLEHRGAVVQRMGQDVNPGLIPGDQFSV